MDHAMSTRRSLRFARRVIVKVGTTTVTHVDGNIALGRVAHLCEQIAQLRHNGHEVRSASHLSMTTASLTLVLPALACRSWS